jgi:hypothetical protein
MISLSNMLIFIKNDPESGGMAEFHNDFDPFTLLESSEDLSTELFNHLRNWKYMSNVNVFRFRPSISFQNKMAPIPFSGLFMEPQFGTTNEKIFIYNINEIDFKNTNLEEKMRDYQLEELHDLL